MSNVGKRLKKLGIELPPCPVHVAAYVPACEAGSLIYASVEVELIAVIEKAEQV